MRFWIRPGSRRVQPRLALHALAEDRRLCKASELGQSYATLMRRFQAPFPGHAHRWLFGRMQQHATPASLR